jgi:hypothetical protein
MLGRIRCDSFPNISCVMMFISCIPKRYSYQFWGISPGRALPPKNLILHFSHQYLRTQSAEQDFFNKNNFFIKQRVKNINFIRRVIAEISRILNVKWKFSCKYFQISFRELVQGIVGFPNLLEPLTSTQLTLSKQQYVRSLSNIKFKSKQFKCTPGIIWSKCLLQCVKGISNKIHSQIVIREWQLILHFPLEDVK